MSGRSLVEIILGNHPGGCECSRCSGVAEGEIGPPEHEHHQELPLLDTDTAELLENEVAIDHWGTEQWAD